MQSSHRSVTNYTRTLWLSLTAFLGCAASFVMYAGAEQRIDATYEQRFRTFLLAGQLRQTSEDLSRMARTYIATGDSAFRRRFQDILDIREGRKSLRGAYEDWDVVLDDNRPVLDDPGPPLIDRMRTAGVTQEELDGLARAHDASSALGAIERAAMDLSDASRGGSVATRDSAIAMVYGREYYRQKDAILAPIRLVNRMADERTQRAVDGARTYSLLTRAMFLLFGALLVLTLWRVGTIVRRVLGGSLGEVFSFIARVEKGGDPEWEIPRPVATDTIMGRLGQMRASLAAADAARDASQRELARSQYSYRQLIEVANEGICVVQDEKICVANPAVLRLLGCSADDIVGRPFVDTIYPGDRALLIERHRRRLQGLPVETGYAFRLVTKDRHIRWCQIDATAVLWEERPATLSFLRDVTEKRDVEERLRQLAGLVLAVPQVNVI